MARIALIVHRYDRLYQPNGGPPEYDVIPTLQAMREHGHEWFVVREPSAFEPADAAILHLDCSIVPDEYRTLAARYPRCLNGECTDISKRNASRALVEYHPDWRGPVIVKTNFNHHNGPEWRHNWQALRRGRTPPHPGIWFKRPYRIYDSLGKVPARIRRDRRFVVEIFKPAASEQGYAIHSWQFFGSNGFAYKSADSTPIIRWGSATTVTDTDIPDLEAERQRLGLEMGKLDFIVLDGQPLVIDANKTVAHGGRSDWGLPPDRKFAERAEAVERLLGLS